jgi:preprotein translocase subunit SecE
MKAVAETSNMEDKGAGEGGGLPAWLAGPLGWLPRKVREGRAFLSEVRGELKKVTWPSRKEVTTTTMVVVVTTVIFGFYLYGLDLLLSELFTRVLRQ